MTIIVYDGGKHELKGKDYYRLKEKRIDVYLFSKGKTYKHMLSNVKYIVEDLGTTRRAKKHPRANELVGGDD